MDEQNSIIIKNDEIVKGNQRDLCDDITRDNIPQNLSEIEIQIDRLKQRWSEFTYLIGQRLQFIRDNKLYRQNSYPDFKSYVTIALKMSENNAYYYIAIYEYFTEEQTRKAGSKLKLIIPILNKVKKDKGMPEELKTERLNNLRDELFYKIHNKTYREAEKFLNQVKLKYFSKIPSTKSQNNKKKIIVKDDRIVIYEDDKIVQEELLKIINDYYEL